MKGTKTRLKLCTNVKQKRKAMKRVGVAVQNKCYHLTELWLTKKM